MEDYMITSEELQRLEVNAWQTAHDYFCDFGDKCIFHHNPYKED